MQVGDLVAARLHTNNTMLGIISKCQDGGRGLDPLDKMFPYFVCFNDNSFNDWFGPGILEVLSESR